MSSDTTAFLAPSLTIDGYSFLYSTRETSPVSAAMMASRRLLLPAPFRPANKVTGVSISTSIERAPAKLFAVMC
ncbi:hypothetical protein L5014_02480 [Paraburkholderia sp. RG36]|uniref:Uncharacterized protein n=1 Tax=Paraburkholderia tagetis TaxID=2913261 RepID=A0A9X1RLV3_9BURK|nr:hypothetical protein [Paraburkholderia tagetis]MCG5072237.1 hypothetical protein [Paraburkholderia tagetis]